MADNYTMGLLGQNNPILQAAQQQNQQSAQLRNVAAEGIVNRISQDYQKKIGAQLKTYANYMESKDPFIFQKGAEGMYSLMGEEMPPDIMERQQEVNLAYSELNRREGKIPPKEFMTLANDVLARFGSLPTGVGERAQQAVETEALGQAAGLPPEDPLLRAGAAGTDVIKSKLTDDPSLDKILARKVESGELTFEKAFELKKKGAPSTTVNVNAGGTAFEKKLGELGAENLMDEKKDAESARQSINTIQEGRKFLNAGAYSGSAANIKQGIDKWLQEGGIQIAGKTAANTEAYAALMGKEVGSVIKLFGSGTGLSDADREYAEKIAAGRITLTEDSKRKLLDIHEKLYRAKIRGYNKKAGKVMKSPLAASFPYGLEVEEPEVIKEEAPPVKGARKAPDGFWYVKTPDGYYKVEE